MSADPAKAPPAEVAESFDVGAPDALQRMIDLFARHGDIYRMYVAARKSYTYVIHHPDDVKSVLQSNHRKYTKGADRDRVKILLGLGLMASEGDLWKRHHEMMQPLFHRRTLERFNELMEAANDRFLAQLERLAATAESIDITRAMSELTLEIVLGSIFGADLPQVAERFALITDEQARDLEFVYKFRSLGAFVGKIMQRRRAGGERHFDYLSLLMEARDKRAGGQMSDREVIDEALTLVVAGHETTASVLNWTWYLLSQHPQVDARLHDEIARSGQASEAAYARQVLNEAMRLYPPGWLLSRRVVEPDTLGGHEVPAGANVLIPLYLLHRHPRYWQQPELFDPDRFAPEREAERPRYVFLPFSAGPRHCIGETFAMYEMLIHLRKIVPRYRLTLVAERPVELDAQINLRSRHPLHMRVERR